jgi:hypothetical protein
MHESPQPTQWRASDEEAVEICREWMIYLGASDATVTSSSTRAVCDVYSSRYLAWVDNRRRNLDMDIVNRAHGISRVDGRVALVFVPGGVFPDAQDLADHLGVAIFQFDSQGGELDGANTMGRRLRSSGLEAT